MPSFAQTFLLAALVPLALAGPVARQLGGGSFSGTTQNGLTDGDCKDITVIFARGTSEAGNVGTVTGPPFFQALAKKVGDDKLAVQGVEYAANIAGIIALGDPAGSKKMASLVEQAFTQCPSTKVVMSGYSQGAMLVHNAAKQLSSNITGKVTAAVTFGDPFQKQAVQGVSAERTKIICHDGDNVCQGGAVILPAHLTYGTENADEAAEFVVKAAGN